MLEDKKFKLKWEPLYNNLYTKTNSVYQTITLFCIIRICLGFCVGIFSESVMPCFICLLICSIVQMNFFINQKPMNTKALNRFEMFNLLVVKISAYFLLIFSDWILKVSIIYEIGYNYMYFFILVTIINVSIISFEIYTSMRKIYKKRKFI